MRFYQSKMLTPLTILYFYLIKKTIFLSDTYVYKSFGKTGEI